MATKATRKVLKSLFLMSALAGALLVAGPTQARDRDHGQRHEYRHDGGGRGGHGWRGHDRGYRGDHGWGGHRQYGHGWQGHGWGYQPYNHYAPSYYHHQHYRGCGHDGYHHGGLVELLIDYSHHD